MATLYYDKDIDNLLEDKTVAIIGYGSQGHAHALNLRDSGVDVVVGLYENSPSKAKAEAEGLTVLSNSEAAQRADIVSMLIPDTKQGQVYKEDIAPNMVAGNTLLFSHGFVIHYGLIVPSEDLDVVMIAPKAPGHRVRAVYEKNSGVPCLVAVHSNPSGTAKTTALAYAKGIGGGRAGVLETTFKEETETDLFGEQAVLCGGVSELIKTGYEVLVEAGYQPESAYFEVLHELKLIVDLIYQGGLEYMRYSVSDTAEYGDYVSGPAVIDGSVKDNMRKILGRIKSGEFAREWVAENDEGLHRFRSLKKKNAEHPIEEVGKELRSMMPWLESST